MPHLSDLQRVLLSTAATREDGGVLPASDKLDAARVRKAIPALLKHGLVDERPVAGATPVWREEDEVRLGLLITQAGEAAIGIVEDQPPSPSPTSAPDLVAAREPRVTKAAQVVALLERTHGATLAELTEATGWLPHTARAALTGLRKKGHGIEKLKPDGVTCYRIAEAG